MLAKNGVIVDPTDTNNPDTIFYLNKVKEIEEAYKYPIKLKLPDRYKIQNPENPGKPLWPGGKTIWFKDTLKSNKTGGEEWEWFETTSRDGEGNPLHLPRNINFTRGGMTINKNQPDLAFFMLYVSSRCEDSLNEDVKNNGEEKFFLVDNPKKESRDKIIALQYEVKAKNLVIVDGDDNLIRECAIGYGIEEAGFVDVDEPASKKIPHDPRGKITGAYDDKIIIPYKMSMAEVRTALWDMVEIFAKNGNYIYEEIVNKLKPNISYGDSKKLVDQLIEKGVIKLIEGEPTKTGANAGKTQKEWIWGDAYKLDEEGREKKTIHKCGYNNTMIDECIATMIKRIDDNPMFRAMMEKVLKKAEIAA